MDVKSEIVTKFSENLSATQSCSPEFVAHLCDLIRAGDSISQDKLMSLVEDESHGKH